MDDNSRSGGPDEPRLDRWGRSDWWGVVLDTDDVATLADFYSRLRGWRIHRIDAHNASLDTGEGVAYLAIQHSDNYVRPVWPAPAGAQQMMLHLDFEVVDVEAETARAVSLGATVADHQPQAHVRVLFDPSGHPFCLYADR